MKAMRIVALAALISSMMACVAKETKVRLKIEARTNQGEPVHAARVLLDGKNLGATSNAGRFETEVSLPAGAKKKVEVHKDSDTYYFAPYYQAFEVEGPGPQEIAVAATLYFVPKPLAPGSAKEPAKAEPAVVAVAEGVKAVQASSAPPSDAGSAAPANAMSEIKVEVKAEPQADAQADVKTAAQAGAAATSPVAVPDQAKPETATAGAIPVQSPTPDTDLAPALPVSVAAAISIDSSAAAPIGIDPAVGGEFRGPQSTVDKVVDKVVDKGAEVIADDLAMPSSTHPNVGSQLFTVHVYAGANPLAGVEVAMGEGDSRTLKTACTTNERGRCVIRFSTKPDSLVTFVATKKGFKTAVNTVEIHSKDRLRINMDFGRSLDIYAVSQAYGHRSGLAGVEVRIAGKRVGETDRFGRYSYIFASKSDDLLSVTLKPKGYLPEVFEADFVTGGELQLIKAFTPDQPPSVRMTVLNPLPAGAVDKETLAELNGAFGESLRAAARRHIYASTAFKEYPFTLYDQMVHRSGKNSGEILRTGWHDSELKGVVDAVLVPTVVTGSSPTLELSVIDSHGRVLSAAKEELAGLTDLGAVDRAVALIAKKISRVFPFEGAVLSKSADEATINLGQSQGRDVQVGDLLDVYGQQAAKLGRSSLHGKIASIKVREVEEKSAKGIVTGLAPRATIERGDLVMLRPRHALKEPRSAPLLVMTDLGGKRTAVSQANIYLNNNWIGSSDSTGRLYVEGKVSGRLRVIKQGFQDLLQAVQLGQDVDKPLVLTLIRQAAFLRIDSQPAGALVKVEGKDLGKTPLATQVPVPSGFVKMEVLGPPGYKPYSTVLELDQGTLDLTGEAAVILEQDLRAVAQRLIKAGKIDAALTILNKIAPEHSDYLMARHEAGELYLTVLDEPAKAAEAFGMVTANPAVKQYVDKRFIGSHINEGIALFLTAERLGAGQPEAAQAHYKKGLEVLEGVVPYLRFVPQGEYAQAVHNVDYHRALCRHRLWTLTQDPRLLADAVKTWRSYLDGSGRAVPVEGPSIAYIENAKVYLKQAAASLSAGRHTSRQ